MLILARTKNERILIGDDIVLTILGIQAGKVRIGISAPRGIPVDREEVRRAMERDSRLTHRGEE